ncbi:MAG: mRNA surveillance protein pelota [Methanosarcinales archaeon]|nr:mRNA surveillance protein pelota [Methanosarcinales archaeon]
MKIRQRKLKKQHGVIELVPESLDDLWHLKYVIENGDLVKAFTKRRIEGATDKIRPEASEKKSVRLTIEVTGIEFHRFSNRLRVHGIIREGIDTGEHHTINIETGSMLSITKDWKSDQLERIEEAVAVSGRPRVTIVTIESGEAAIGLVRQFGVDMVAQITQPSGKERGDFTHEFFFSVASALDQMKQETQHAIIIAGPGFMKEDFMEYLRSSKPEIAARAVLEDTVSTGMPGFLEVLRRGAVDRIVHESRIGRETELMESLMREIAIDGKCAYGWNAVKNALDLGAIETLLIVDETLRDFREAKAESDIEADALLRRVEHTQGRVVIFSSEFEPGQRLSALGGVAALLRFRIYQ